MYSSGRVLLCASLLAALAACYHFATAPAGYWPARVPREGWRADDMDATIAAIRKRIRLRLEAAEALVGGRLTLLEAAAFSRDLDRTAPRDFSWRDSLNVGAGETPEESHCWEVISLAGLILHDQPARAAAVRRRLEEELQQHLRRGPLRLAGPAHDVPTPRAAAE